MGLNKDKRRQMGYKMRTLCKLLALAHGIKVKRGQRIQDLVKLSRQGIGVIRYKCRHYATIDYYLTQPEQEARAAPETLSERLEIRCRSSNN